MRHATIDDLQSIDELLRSLRSLDGLVERGPGRFYRKGGAFLHFHVDEGRLFSDLKEAGEWVRRPHGGRQDARRLLAAVRRAMSGKS